MLSFRVLNVGQFFLNSQNLFNTSKTKLKSLAQELLRNKVIRSVLVGFSKRKIG